MSVRVRVCESMRCALDWVSLVVIMYMRKKEEVMVVEEEGRAQACRMARAQRVLLKATIETNTL